MTACLSNRRYPIEGMTAFLHVRGIQLQQLPVLILLDDSVKVFIIERLSQMLMPPIYISQAISNGASWVYNEFAWSSKSTNHHWQYTKSMIYGQVKLSESRSEKDSLHDRCTKLSTQGPLKMFFNLKQFVALRIDANLFLSNKR